MKKTNFFKLFLVGAVALTVGLSGCTNYVSEKDFKAACAEIDALQNDVDELERQLNALGTAVKDVTGNECELTVTYTNGQSAKINIPCEGGTGGGSSFITIKDGKWWIDGKNTGFDANELTPRINSEEDGNHFWEFPVLNDKNEVVWEPGEDVIAAAYAVNNNGVWTLWLPTEDHTELQAITIGEGGGGLNKIDILGWVEDYEVTDDLSAAKLEAAAEDDDPLKGELYSAAEKTFVVYYNVIEAFSGDTNGASKPAVTTEAPDHDYADGGAIYASAAAGYAPAVTSFGIATKTALTTLDAQNKGLIVQANGSDLSGYDFVLEDSKKRQLPIAFKKPVLVSGLLTRAAKDSDLWFIEGTDRGVGSFDNDAAFANKFTPDALYTLVTPAGFRSEYTPFTFIPTLVSSLEGQVIEVDGEEFQAAANNIDASWYVNVGVENELTFDDVYFFDDGLDAQEDQARHDLEIDVAGDYEGETLPYTVSTPATNGVDPKVYTNSVIDWYIEVGSNPNDQYITTEFKVYFDGDQNNKTGGKTFTVGQLPDELTQASFSLNVYKLGIDGVVYYERIRIHPVREDIVTEIDLGDYIVEDGFPGTTGNNATDYLGSVLNIPLDKMFDTLEEYVDAQGAKMSQRWRDEEYGAWSYTITNLTIEGVNGSDQGKGQLGRFMFPDYIERGVANGSTGTTSVGNAATQADMTGEDITEMGQAAWMLGDNATAIFAVNEDGDYIDPTGLGLGEYPLWDAREFDIYPNYAYNNGTTDVASFVIGKKHTVTVEFFDKDNQKLNTIVVTFKPILPELKELFVKEPEYWNEAQTRLYAYYKTPDNWYNGKFYGVVTPTMTVDATFGVAPEAQNMTFYNVYNPGGTTALQHTYNTPLDGGYTKIGLRNETDKRWVTNTSIGLEDPAFKIGGVTALGAGNLLNFLNSSYFGAGKVNGVSGANSVIYLYNQTNPYAANAAASNFVGLPKPEPNAYGKVLPMIWNLGPYIGYYTMEGTEKFEMQVLSALAEGEVKEIEDSVVGDAAPANGQFLSLNDDHIKLENYNDQPFSVFKVWNTTRMTGVYAYTYIYHVEFSRPEGVSVYDIMTPDPTNAGDWIQANEGARAIEPTGTATETTQESYVALRPNNLTGQADTKIHVKIYDRFGRTVEGDVDITLKVATVTP